MTFMDKVYTLRTEVYSEGWNLWDETLYNRAFRVPKSVEELIFDAEQRELLRKTISTLPEIQRQRFLL